VCKRERERKKRKKGRVWPEVALPSFMGEKKGKGKKRKRKE
jgi:hypothetical protein